MLRGVPILPSYRRLSLVDRGLGFRGRSTRVLAVSESLAYIAAFSANLAVQAPDGSFAAVASFVCSVCALSDDGAVTNGGNVRDSRNVSA